MHLRVATILSLAGGMKPHVALLFGAMVSATDPVSVIALFRKMSMNKRLTMILEGESLVNDGAAAVFFKMFLALVLTEESCRRYTRSLVLPHDVEELWSAF